MSIFYIFKNSIEENLIFPACFDMMELSFLCVFSQLW